MLKKLYIKNFAIVDELEIEFEQGFQVITGETGAGKSILVGALALLCGERGQTDLVRVGTNKAILEAEFRQIDAITTQFLAQNGLITESTCLLIRREIQANGSSRGFINDSPVTMSILSRISTFLIDLHGQHQHQRLLNPDSHIHYLDDFGKLGDDVNKVVEAYTKYHHKRNELQALIDKKETVESQKDLYLFQIDELNKAGLRENESAELESERLKMENSELLFSASHQISTLLYSGEETALDLISNAIAKLTQVGKIDKEFKSQIENLETARVTIQEIGRFCEEYSTSLEFDPQRLEEIRNREAQIDWLLKKYQKSNITELIDLRNELGHFLQEFDDYEQLIQQKQNEVEACRVQLETVSLSLSDKRKNIASGFEQRLVELLKSVGLIHADFRVVLLKKEDPDGQVHCKGKKYAVQKNGIDSVEFQIGLNIGESVRPLHKIASGGEVSRIMLCIKALLADADSIDTLVFDEIDSGISGRFAQIVGQKLRHIASDHQLIVITHLPQIAAQGAVHYSVRKTEANGRTVVDVKKLTFDERIADIAGLLGGRQVTQNAMTNARELLLEGRNATLDSLAG